MNLPIINSLYILSQNPLPGPVRHTARVRASEPLELVRVRPCVARTLLAVHPLDYEPQCLYRLTVQVRNPDGKAKTAVVAVSDKDEIENAPDFTGEPTSFRVNMRQTNAQMCEVVAEYIDSGTNAEVSYSLEDTAEIFSINAACCASGQLQTRFTLYGWSTANSRRAM